MNKQIIKRVLLIVPPITLDKEVETKRVSEPLGLAYMAAVLKRNGYEVRILDTILEGFDQETLIAGSVSRVGLTTQQILGEVRGFAPDVVGISCQFSDHSRQALETASSIKQEFPETIMVMGGVHATAVPAEVLSCDGVDYVLTGEADLSFVDLIHALEAGQGLDRVDGLAWRENGRTVVSPKKHFIDDLDSLPLPARELLNYPGYFRVNRFYRRPPLQPPALNIITSRCCPANCIFCSTHSIMGRYRTRSAERVLDEIELLINDYAIREIYFLDDNFTYDKARASEILDGMISRGFDLAWSTPNGVAVYALDEPLLEKMKRSGCYSLFFAVESADPDVLKNIMHKPVNVAKIPPLVKIARSLGIEVHGLFVIGLPGETREQIQRTIDFAENTGFDYVTFSIATPYPGTRLYEICKEKGYIPDNLDYSVLKFGRGNIRTSEFDPEYLEEIRRTAWERINGQKDNEGKR